MEACEQMEPSVRAIFTNTEVDGKIVLAAEIPSVEYWSRPVFYKGAGRLKGSYVRVGDADEHMSEYEVYSYEAFRRRIREEMRIVPECGMDMLEEAVDFVRKNMRTKTIVGDNGKRSDKDEYPIIAVREAVLNALIHRD